MSLVMRMLLLTTFAAGVIWMLLQSKAAEEGDQQLKQFEQELGESQDAAVDQRKMLEDQIKKQQNLAEQREEQLLKGAKD